VRAVAERSGLSGDQVAEATSDVEVKAALRAANDEAVAHGAFGVPTVRVGAACSGAMIASKRRQRSAAGPLTGTAD
jgi:predicted DsbA family dithiol-disulfide isomerase